MKKMKRDKKEKTLMEKKIFREDGQELFGES